MARLVTVRRGRKTKYKNLNPFYSLPRDTTKAIVVSRKLGGIGDIIMTLPAIRGLREKYPKAHITYAVCNKWGSSPTVLLKLLEGNPYPNEVVGITPHAYPELEKLINKHEFYVDITGQELAHEYKGKSMHRIDLFCERLQVAPRSKIPELFLNKDELYFGEEFVKAHCSGPKPIAFQTSCYGGTRNWAFPRFREVASYIVNKLGRQVIIISDSASAKIDIPGVINRIGNPIRLDAAIIKNCSMLIGADSGLLHVAGAMRTPVLGLFGSVPPMSRLGYYVDASWVWHSEMPCIGCYYRHNCPPYKGNIRPCMDRITVEEVCTHIKSKLDRYNTRSRIVIPTTTITDIKPQLNNKTLVAVLTFDLLEKTKRTINSIVAKTPYDVLVVDNFSTDNTFNWLIANNISFIRKETSIAGAINICIQEMMAGGYQYLLMCNNDIKLAPRYLDVLIKEYQSLPDCGFITGITMNVEDRVKAKFRPLVENKATAPIGPIFYTGEFSAFLISRNTVERVGLFDKVFSPRYIEDDDYKHRIELAGLKLYRTGKTTFEHDCGATIHHVVPKKPKKWQHNFEANILKYIEKWGGGPSTLTEHQPGKTIISKGYDASGGKWTTPYNNSGDARIFETKYEYNSSPSNVLMIQPEQMGDIVLALPVAYDLKQKYPAVKITWAVNPKLRSLFEAVPYVDDLIDCTPKTIDSLIEMYKSGDTYDRIYVMNIAHFSAGHFEHSTVDFVTCVQSTGGCGKNIIKRTPTFVPSEPIVSCVNDMLLPLSGKDLIAVSLHSYSQKPKISYAIMDQGLKLARREFPNVEYIYLGGPREEYSGVYKPMHKIHNNNLGAIPEILSRCKAIITVNSGNMWIATGINGLPIYGISASVPLCDGQRKLSSYLSRHLLKYVGFKGYNYVDVYDKDITAEAVHGFIHKSIIRNE